MANFPGANYQIPGVYGPSGMEIIKIKEEYAIGFTDMNNWGGPWIKGTVKEIARDIVKKCAISNDQTFYCSLCIQWKPQVTVTFTNDTRVIGFIGPEFSFELERELVKLSKLLPFT